MSASALPEASARCRPSAVSVTPRAWRWNRATPRRASSLRTWWLTALAVRCSSSAACAKFWWRAADSKAERAGSQSGRRTMRASNVDLCLAAKVCACPALRARTMCGSTKVAFEAPRMSARLLPRCRSARRAGPGSPRSSSRCSARSGAPRSCSCAWPRRSSAPRRWSRCGSRWVRRSCCRSCGATRALPAAAVAEARADRRDQFGGAVRAVRVGRAARAGGRGRDLQLR